MPNADTIDERVVEMRIDNRQFVKGANQTIGVLDKLKEALSFKKATKGFDDISKAANRIDLGGLSDTLNQIDSKLEYLTSKTRMMMENLVRDIYSKSKQLLNSLTVDQISAGWSKYDNMTQSIHTIMGATADSWDKTLERISRDYGFVGDQLDFVNQQLDRMLWFTDETSASFTDMTSNVGKWTNIGFELDEAAIAMMGVATWGYKAGAGVAEQARAMYNLSQAAGIGKVTMIDWKSIENANMATMEFKNVVLEAAVAAGTLTKDVNGIYRTIDKKTEVSATNFRDVLSEGFFTSDVLMSSLYTYGHFASLMQTVVEDTGVSTRDMVQMVGEFKDGTFDANKWMIKLSETMREEEIPSYESLMYAMELLGKEEDDLGYKAFKASQETKTLAEAIDYTKDAVSSGWMKTWQYIVGDYDEAKEFWTNVTDELYELFVKAGERRNAILSVWKDSGGRDELLKALGNVYTAIKNLIEPIKKAFDTIFGLGDIETAGGKLYDLTVKFRKFTETLTISEDTLKGMEGFFTKLFEKVKIVLGYLRKAFSIFGKVFGYITRIFGAFFRAWSSGTFDANQFLTEMNDILSEIGEKLKNAWTRIKQFVDSLKDIPVVGPVLQFIVKAVEKIWNVFGWIIDKIKGIKIESEGVEGPWDKVRATFESLWDRIKSIDIDTQKLKDTFQKVAGFFSALWEGLVGDPEEFKKTMKNFFKNAFDGLLEAAKEIDFQKVLEGAKVGVLIYIASKVAGMITSMKKTVDTLQSIPDAIKNGITNISNAVVKSLNANVYIKIAVAIALLAASIMMLSQIDDNKFMFIALTLVTMFALLAKAAKSVGEMDMFSNNSNKIGVLIKGFSKTAQMMIGLAAFLAAAAYAMKEISSLSVGEIIKGLIVIGIITALALIAMKKMNKELSNEQGNLKSLLKLTAIAAAIAAAGKAIATLAKLPIAGVIIAAVAIGIVLSAMALVINQATKFEKGAGAAVGTIIALVVAIYALIIPMTMIAGLAALSWKSVAIATGVILVLMAAIAGFMALGGKIGESAGLVTFALTLLAVSGAFLIFAVATAVFVPALASLIAVLLGFMAILGSMDQGDFGTMAKRLAILGAALVPLAIVLVLVGVAALTFGLGILAAGLGVNTFVRAIRNFALAIALVAVAVKLFVDAIAKIIETTSKYGEQFISTLEWLLTAIIGLLVAKKMYIANAALSIILAVITVIANVGGGELINTVHTILMKLFNFLGSIAGDIVDFLVGFLVYILKRFADSLDANRHALVIQIERIVGIILSIVIEVTMSLLYDVAELIFGSLLKLFGVDTSEFFDKLKADAMAAGDQIVKAFDHSDEFEQAGKNSGGTLAVSIAEGATEEGGSIVDAIGGIISGGNKVVDDNNNTNAPILGGNFDIGIAQGIEDHIPDVTGSIDNLTGAMTGQFANNLGINSPSKVGASFGRFWDLGLAFGIRDNLSEVTESNDELTQMMTDALMTAMSIVGKIADEDLSIKPVVKPVVDMSNVNSAGSMMSGMFGSVDVGAVNARVSDAASTASDTASSVDAFGNSVNSNDSFVINVYSQPGMDENELANAVMYKIQNGIMRKGAALG